METKTFKFLGCFKCGALIHFPSFDFSYPCITRLISRGPLKLTHEGLASMAHFDNALMSIESVWTSRWVHEKERGKIYGLVHTDI